MNNPVPKAEKPGNDREELDSGIYEVPFAQPNLPVVIDVKHIHPVLIEKINRTISEAIRKIRGPVANEDGQFLMFPELSDDLLVPQGIAEEVRHSVLSTLHSSGIDIQTGATFSVVKNEERDDPHAELGGR